jgi:hypothetical protein
MKADLQVSSADERPGLATCLAALRCGDVLVVLRLDPPRLSTVPFRLAQPIVFRKPSQQ